jgi:DNA-binding transcriptional regulator YbjK
LIKIMQPTQARSRRRREALLRAAIDLIAESGVRAVTHRAVAARAGVPVAATTYYFASIQELTEEALRQQISERVAELTEISAQAAEGGRTIEEVALRFADSLVGRDRNAVIAQFEVYLEAARSPALRPAVADALRSFHELTEASLRALGARRPKEGAAAFFAMLDGFALHRVTQASASPDDAEALFEALRALFIGYVVEDEELAQWHKRFQTEQPGPVA